VSEQTLWHWVRERFGKYGLLRRVENRVGVGMPDLYYCIECADGWIEFEEIEAWPVKPSTTVSVPCLSLEQKDWLHQLAYHGGRGLVWLRVRSSGEHLLFAGAHAHQIGTRTQKQMRALARLAFMQRTFAPRDRIAVLRLLRQDPLRCRTPYLVSPVTK
jgi:hypothetical protein